MDKGALVEKILRILLVCSGALWGGSQPGDAMAFALGDLQLLGKPGQPFRAMAPITLDPGEEISSVTMGSAADYRLLSLPRKAVVDAIVPQVKEQDGRRMVFLQSAEPVQERDFQILLRVASNQHTYFPFFRVQPPVVAEEPKRLAQAVAPEQAEKKVGEPRKSAAKKERRYGPVRKKEGLKEIAHRFQKGSPFTVAQLEVAIWRRNPNQFVRNNMRGLKPGSKLIIPAAAEIALVDKEEAEQLCLNHTAEWKKSPRERAQSALPAAVASALVAPVLPEGDTVTTQPAPEKETPKETPKNAGDLPAGKEPDKEQVKVESGALKSILVQLQAITRVLENHHERQDQLEKRVANLEKNQEQREQLERRVTNLEQSMKEWNFLTKERRVGSESGQEKGVPVAVSPMPSGKERGVSAPAEKP
ncbi:MAG: hypothetical protein H7837_02180 [Magnetococcus sp. MYC-9]